MEKKSYHHGNLEESLIEAGLSLVDKEGLEAMSLRRVAAMCGVSHAAPYKHFAGKEELVLAMQRYVEERFARVLEEVLAQTGDKGERMHRMGERYIRFFMENPHYFSFFQRQGSAVVNLDDLEEQSGYRPFEVFKGAAMEALEGLALPREARDRSIIAMWVMVHGCTSVAVMRGVRYSGDWSRILGSLMIGGTHRDE